MGTNALDLSAHGGEHFAEVFDFGFTGGEIDAGIAWGEGGGHDDVCGTCDGAAVAAS